MISRPLILAMLLTGGCMPPPPSASLPDLPDPAARPWTLAEGGVIRGDTSKKQLALIFTGGDFGEGTEHILDVLAQHKIKASFFLTCDFLRHTEYRDAVVRIIKDGHFLGPHSDTHPLYCPWEDRHKTFVTEEFFEHDLQKNIADLRSLGALRDQVVYFIPPYEW